MITLPRHKAIDLLFAMNKLGKGDYLNFPLYAVSIYYGELICVVERLGTRVMQGRRRIASRKTLYDSPLFPSAYALGGIAR